MQDILSIAEIKRRAGAIRLSMETLARMAGINASTAHRAVRGLHDNRVSTLRKLSAALVAEERAQLDHLRKLDGEAA